MSTVGVDLGGTKIASVLVDNRRVTARRFRTHSAVGYEQYLELIASEVLALRNTCSESVDIEAVGVGIAGVVDEGGRVVVASNLGIRDRQLRDDLERLIGVRVVVDNDAHTASIAERSLGTDERASSKSLIMLTLGTGVGGSVLLDGRPVRGATGRGSHLGHIVVRPGGIQCGCGRRGCLETVASGPAVVARARALTDGGLTIGSDTADRRTPAFVVDAARAGDPNALAIFEEIASAIASAVSVLAPIVDPDTVVLGGGFGLAAAPLLVDLLSTTPPGGDVFALDDPRVRYYVSELGAEGGAVGAALLARDAEARARQSAVG